MLPGNVQHRTGTPSRVTAIVITTFDLDIESDHRFGDGSRAARRGRALLAVGNLLHPLDHGDAAELNPTWEAAHLGVSAGAILVAAGAPALVAVAVADWSLWRGAQIGRTVVLIEAS